MSATANRTVDIDLARTILAVTPHFYRTVGRAVRASNTISFDRFKVLMRLDRHPEGIRSGDLAHHWHLTAPAVTKLVDELVRDGLVKRARDASDGRAVILTLTPEGRRQLRRFFEVAAGAVADLLATLTPAERERLRDAFADLERLLNGSGERSRDGSRAARAAVMAR